ncbi:DUF2007 domain-containing protein [Coralliovum pocilloporae]|uniref:putative signal transducing protein n=1 Tax=Coralliovum pocilloporae TaxID=3066369 RepID=UPI0033073FD1
MDELIKTNDMVVISFVEALLKDAGIPYLTADQNMSIVEGSLGIIPRRILVESDHLQQARRILREAEIGHELPEEKP